MFNQCRGSISCSTEFLRELLEIARKKGEKCNFRRDGIDFLIFPNGIIENAFGEQVKIVDSNGIIKNVE